MSSLKSQVISSTKWNTIATVFNLGLQFVKLIVLTRLLDKSDFGLVAIASMVIAFTSLFSELGLTIAIIHKQDTTASQYSSIYWANVMLSLLLYAILFLATPFVATFYKEDILKTIVPILGLEIIANAFGKIFQTVKMKNLEYKFLSITTIICCSIGFVTTILLAWMHFGVFSLVYGQLVQVCLTQLVFFISGFKKMGITFHFSFNEIKDYLKIGIYSLGSKILDFISGKLDIFLIGRFFGMDDLGVYNLAKELIIKPYSILGKIITNVAMSSFAKIQNNSIRLRETFAQMLKLLTFISMPLFAILFVFSDLIVNLFYSARFVSAVPLVKVLCVYGSIALFEFVSITVRDAKGKTNKGLVWTLVSCVITIIAIIAASNTNIFIFACAISFVTLITFWPFWRINIKGIVDISFRGFVALLRTNTVIAVLSAVPFYLLCMFVSNMYLQIVFIIVYVLIYLFIQNRFNNKDFVVVSSLVKDLIKMPSKKQVQNS